MVDGYEQLALREANQLRVPVGLELMQETPVTAIHLGDLACLGRLETEHHDDFITVNKIGDPHLGVDLDLEFGSDNVLSLT